MWEKSSKWNVHLLGFEGRTIYVGHGDDIRGNDAKHRYGDLLLPTKDESFSIYGYSASWGDVCFMFPDGPLFIGNNPEIGPPEVEMRWGDTSDNRKIDVGVTSNFEVDGIRYSFHRPEDQSGDFKVFDVTITHI
jgi:hypothetical protein